MRNPALDYYLHDGPTAFRFELRGVISDNDARRLEQIWLTAFSLIGERRPIIDITFVTAVDEQGRAVLAHWQADGAQFVANSQASRALAESILGAPVAEPVESIRRWLPFRVPFLKSAAGVPWLLAALLFTFTANAATLKTETVAAWDEYVESAKANLQRRLQPGGCFLWTLEDPDRAARVRSGEIVVAPAPGPNPRKVPGGLIHPWMGAMFLPGATIEQVLEVTRDYDRYRNYYQPYVIDSKMLSHDYANDLFTMRIANKKFFVTTALDAEYQATIVRADEHRVYTISRTTRVQEIEDYGEPGEHSLPEEEGGGYIWKLFSIARFEERDAGVYVEIEAMALSREIPAAARFLIDPIVRRLSRNSLLISMQQTEDALRGRAIVSQSKLARRSALALR